MYRITCLVFLTLSLIACSSDDVDVSKTHQKPNLIIMYVDDLGYGDVGSYGAVGVETPNIDRLAKNGVRFTDAHSSAATCTPSRYSLLTGEHGFRNKAAILPGDAPLLISPDQSTLPKMLKRAGYTTAVVGKWHLGLGVDDVDWNKDIKPGPLEIGFDYSFLLPATGDRVPTVYVENHRVVGLDPKDLIQVSYQEKIGNRATGYENPEQLRVTADAQHSKTIVNGVSRIGYMAGGESALWVDEEFPDIFTEKAISFLRRNKDKPFFLFHSFHDIHVPRLPNPRFIGKSTMGPRGDAIVQMDWMVGEIIKELEQLGIAENTIIIFTSDNGPILDDGYTDNAEEMVGAHKPAGVFRGAKYSAFEAGTRVPTILTWPSMVKPVESDALVSQMDIYASMAKLVGVDLKEGEAMDSFDILDTLIGQSKKGREYLLKESIGGLSVRQKNWKYIAPIKSTAELPSWIYGKKVEIGISDMPQLYDLSVDISEQQNIADKNPQLVKTLQAKIEEIVSEGYK